MRNMYLLRIADFVQYCIFRTKLGLTLCPSDRVVCGSRIPPKRMCELFGRAGLAMAAQMRDGLKETMFE